MSGGSGQLRRALVLGASGYVGRWLVDTLGPDRGIGTWHSQPIPGMPRFDALAERLADLLPRLPGDISHVFIPYGTVNPDQCAREPEETARTNVASIIGVIEHAQAAGLVPVFLSTDYVFDGTRGSREEGEAQSPNTEYGRQKATVEQWLQGRGGPWMIARLSKVVGTETDIHSVLGPWVNDVKAGRSLRCATDQIFSPAYVADITRALVHLADHGATGIWHVAGDAFSRFDLCRILLDAIREADPSVDLQPEPCLLAEIPFAESRPLNTSLSVEKMKAILPFRFTSMADLSVKIAHLHFGAVA